MFSNFPFELIQQRYLVRSLRPSYSRRRELAVSSRFTRNLGIVTYGFNGMHPDDDPALSNIHGTDESIGIKSLVNSTKVMLILAYNMLVE